MFRFLTKFIKRWFRNFLGFLGLVYVYDGFVINGGVSIVVLAGFVMTFIEIFFQPLLKMLLVPVNIITFGMFSWLLTTIELLIVVYMVNLAEFRPFAFESFRFLGFEIGGMNVNMFFSVILGTIIFNFLTNIIKKLSSSGE